GQERVQLLLAEPDAGQLMPLAAPVLAEAVAVLGGVVLDRGIHAFTQVLQIALERRRRHLQQLPHVREAHAATAADQHLDLVEAFGAVHEGSPADRSGWPTINFLSMTVEWLIL